MCLKGRSHGGIHLKVENGQGRCLNIPSFSDSICEMGCDFLSLGILGEVTYLSGSITARAVCLLCPPCALEKPGTWQVFPSHGMEPIQCFIPANSCLANSF